jgi:HEAT repeat protein
MKQIIALTCAAYLAGSFVSPVRAQEKIEPKYEGKPLAYWIERLQRSETDEARGKAVRALMEFEQEAAPVVPLLVKMLDDRSEDFREQVGLIMCSIGPAAKSAVPTLLRSLKDKTARSPGVVIKVLGAIGPEAREAVPIIIDALDGKFVIDRLNSQLSLEYSSIPVEALCKIGTAGGDVVPAIRRNVYKRVKAVSLQNFSFLADLPNLGDPGISLLIEFLDVSNPALQKETAELLGKQGPKAKNARLGLERLFTHSSAWIRLTAALASWKIDQNEAAIAVLIKILQEGDVQDTIFIGGDTTLVAAYHLEEIGPPAKQAIPELVKAHEHRRNRDRTAFLDAIKAIDPEAAKKIQAPK